MKMEKQVIFGVFEKTNGCDSYTGYFRFEEDAKKELKNQMSRLKEEFGFENLILKNDRVVKENERIEEIYFIIHPIILR
jgi:hypothetical protein